jgi:hypothetical protein
MDNNTLLSLVTAKAQEWLKGNYDAETKAEVQKMLDNEDKSQLIDAFYKDLEFGTGGLRGIMGAGTNRMNIYTVGAATQGLSNYLLEEFSDKDEIKVVVGYDCRNNSRKFAEITANILSANGIKVCLFEDLRPTPAVSYAIRKLGCQSGVMITASHNPKEYNGYKVYWDDGALIYKGNPDLSWETSTSYNLGFDYAMFNNSLTGSLEYFGRKSGDMLYNKPTAGSLGYTSIPMNIGSMTNSGIELDVNWNAVNTRDINWDIYFNATSIKNRINELHPDLEGKMIDGTRIYEEGESMYRMYLVEYGGVDVETGLAQYWATDAETGERYLTDDYAVAQNHRIATNDLLPKVYGGFGTSVTAYGFDAGIQFAYQLGGEIFDSGYQRLMHSGYSSSAGMNWHKDIYNAWTPENTNTDVPRLNANDRYANSTSTRFLTSSDYLSLNSVTLGYTIPVQKLAFVDISRLRIYVVAENVGILTSRKGLDPRQSYISATTARYTPIRSVSGGVSLTF